MSAEPKYGYLFDLAGNKTVSDERYALVRCYDLLTAALRDDAARRWWQPPNRLWASRAQHALHLVETALALTTESAHTRTTTPECICGVDFGVHAEHCPGAVLRPPTPEGDAT